MTAPLDPPLPRDASHSASAPTTMTSATITIRVGEDLHQVPRACTLADVLVALQQDGRQVATALNGRFVPRARRSERVMADGDRVLLFAPIVGG